MLTRPPSLRAIAAFDAAARHGSFTLAADELNLTRSAISHAVQGLEVRIGAALFARVGRSVTLTPEGTRFAQCVRASLKLLTDGFDRRAVLGGVRLSIGVEGSVAARILAPRVAQFRALHADICLDLKGVATASALLTGEIDLVVRAGAATMLGVASHLLTQERLIPVADPMVARSHAFPGAQAGLLIESREHSWSLWFASAERRPPSGLPDVCVDTDMLAIEAAKAGLGFCLAPKLMIERELDEGRLIAVGLDEVAAQSGYYLDWSPTSQRLREIEIFSAWLAAAFGRPKAASFDRRNLGRGASVVRLGAVSA